MIIIQGFASYFVAFEMMMRRTEEANAFYTLMAGGLAGTFSWLISFPIDVVKSRLQVDGIDGKTKYSGAMDCVKKSYQQEGFKFFTRGLNSTLMRAFPMNAVCFLVVSYVMKFFDNSKTIDITLAQPEPLAMAGSYQQSFLKRVFNRTQSELKHSTTKYMIFLDGLHEVACHNEMMELSDTLREQRNHTEYFYKFNDGFVLDNLSEDEMKTPLSC